MCESPFYLCVPLTRSAPGFCRQLCFAGHQTICSADLIFNSFCVFIVVGNQWVKREVGEFEIRRSVKSGRHELENPIPSYPVHLLQNQFWQPGTPIKKWGKREQWEIPVKNWRKRESRFFPGRLVQWPQAYEDKQSKKNTHWHQYEDYKGSQSPFLNPIYINHDAGHQWPQCNKGLWCWIQTQCQSSLPKSSQTFHRFSISSS